MKIAFAVLLALLYFASGPVIAEDFFATIAVYNSTSADVTFVESDKKCVTAFPTSFIVQAGATTNIVVAFKNDDFYGALCTTTPKKIEYVQSDNANNHFGLFSYITGASYPCPLVNEGYGVYLCPTAVGGIFTTVYPPPSNVASWICPPGGVPYCPPANTSPTSGLYGFLVSNDSVGVAPPATPGQQPIPAMAPLGSLLLILALAALGALRLRRR